jgi:hypothetical protein
MRKAVLLMGLLIFSFSLSLSCDRGGTGKTLERPKHNADTRTTTAKDLYELSERCGKTCAQRFKEEYGKEGTYPYNGQLITRGYTSHYNAKLNKCFILIEDSVISKEASKSKLLWDINENKEYGQYFAFREDKKLFHMKTTLCVVLEMSCKSEQEWDLLVKPYMEE